MFIPSTAVERSRAMSENHTPHSESRPWGSFTVLVDEPNHKVKTITIKAGQRISLQRHQKRAEVWIVVSGRLAVLRCSIPTDTKNPYCTVTVDVGQIVCIPRGMIHRAKALDGDATFIEVQTGTYFGEDDIERFEDDYGRIS